MTIVVAVRKGKRAAIACDTQTNFGGRRTSPENYRTSKLRKVGTSWIAFAGWSIYGNILEDHLRRRKRPPSLRDETAIFDFYLKLWKELRERYPFTDERFGDDESPFADLDANFLVVNRNGIFNVSDDMSVSRFEQYDAIGAGADFAFGALHVLYEQLDDPLEIARGAVAAAVHFQIHCGGAIEETRIG